MNRTETLRILAVLKGAYPAFYRDMGAAEAQGVAALWNDLFTGEPYALVAAAVKALIAADERGFPPHIGAVKARVRQLGAPPPMDEAGAWGAVSAAICRSGYRAAEEFEKLPPLIQTIVGSPGQLRRWSQMDSDTVQSVVASNFQRAFRARQARQQAWDDLPPDVRALAEQWRVGALPPGAD